jgi:hypothetical protein
VQFAFWLLPKTPFSAKLLLGVGIGNGVGVDISPDGTEAGPANGAGITLGPLNPAPASLPPHAKTKKRTWIIRMK